MPYSSWTIIADNRRDELATVENKVNVMLAARQIRHDDNGIAKPFAAARMKYFLSLTLEVLEGRNAVGDTEDQGDTNRLTTVLGLQNDGKGHA